MKNMKKSSLIILVVLAVLLFVVLPLTEVIISSISVP